MRRRKMAEPSPSSYQKATASTAPEAEAEVPSATTTTSATMIPNKPRILSICNFLAYALNVIETSGFGPFSSQFSSNQDNGSISQKYQTIITPHGIAFSIWGIIFLSQAICVVLTLVSKRHMAHPLIVDGVSFWFVAVCLAQTFWSPAFAYEKIFLSAILMGCILLPLAMIALGQYKVTTKYLGDDGSSASSWKGSDYWLLQFPFEIHLGWILAAFVLSVNLVAVAWGGSASAQVFVGAASLVFVVLVSFACLLGLKRPQFTVPWVAAWATYWMSYELQNPKPLIEETFSSDQIHSFYIATITLSIIIAASTLIRWIHYKYFVVKAGTAAGQESGEALLLGD